MDEMGSFTKTFMTSYTLVFADRLTPDHHPGSIHDLFHPSGFISIINVEVLWIFLREGEEV